jgi:hypothetical protein
MGTHICVPYHISFNNQDTMGMVRHYGKLIYFSILKMSRDLSPEIFRKFSKLIQMRYSTLYLSKPFLSILGANRDKIIPAFRIKRNPSIESVFFPSSV